LISGFVASNPIGRLTTSTTNSAPPTARRRLSGHTTIDEVRTERRLPDWVLRLPATLLPALFPDEATPTGRPGRQRVAHSAWPTDSSSRLQDVGDVVERGTSLSSSSCLGRYHSLTLEQQDLREPRIPDAYIRLVTDASDLFEPGNPDTPLRSRQRLLRIVRGQMTPEDPAASKPERR
jgi:hypothetical protein